VNVATVSIVRNSALYVGRFARQLAGLRDGLAADGHTLRSIVIEGDSTDGSWHLLQAAMLRHALRADLSQFNHGGPVFASVEDDTRWRNISRVYNAALDRLTAADDWVLHVEADLIWAPETLAGLLCQLRDYDAVAPLILLRPGHYYDTFGSRTLDGRRFQPAPPFHPDGLDGLTEIGAAGSCLAVRGGFARQARWQPLELVSVGWCAQLRAQGARIWVDPASEVVHP
jgi:hypothetical protein